MKYTGTRNNAYSVSASRAILEGICPDGGLYVPEETPRLDKGLHELMGMDYRELAFFILKAFLSDFTEEELRDAVNGAYDDKFDTPLVAPLANAGNAHFLELFHGRTIAFKDMALSILPYLMKISARKNGMDKEIAILTATSGDTGKAALEGFAGVPGTRIMVFFPENGVSLVQRMQMVTQEGENTCVAGILGNFDDAQTAVKNTFMDKELGRELDAAGVMLSSANSINIGRLVPQVVYYFYAYLRMAAAGEIDLGEKINFTVPTGNFGNILAGYYAKEMGLPVNRLICASNDNKVLYDFFRTGKYDKNREFTVTISPSMDILVSSNLERLLYHKLGAEKTAELMNSLGAKGEYSAEMEFSDFAGEFATEEETRAAINELFMETGYVMDPHTAVAYAAYKKYKGDKGTKNIVVSTASPYKFAKDVLCAIDKKYSEEDDFRAMYVLEELSGTAVPAPVRGIEKRKIIHSNICPKEGIKGFVRDTLISGSAGL